MKAIEAHAYLLEAIISKWNGASSLDGVPMTKDTKLDEDDGHPYCIMLAGTTEDEQWTCKNYYFLTDITFRVYDSTDELANASAALVSEVFGVEGLELTFTSGGLVSHRGTSSVLVEAEPRSVHYQDASFNFRTWLGRG